MIWVACGAGAHWLFAICVAGQSSKTSSTLFIWRRTVLRRVLDNFVWGPPPMRINNRCSGPSVTLLLQLLSVSWTRNRRAQLHACSQASGFHKRQRCSAGTLLEKYVYVLRLCLIPPPTPPRCSSLWRKCWSWGRGLCAIHQGRFDGTLLPQKRDTSHQVFSPHLTSDGFKYFFVKFGACPAR